MGGPLILLLATAWADDGAARLAEIDAILTAGGSTRGPRKTGGFCPSEAVHPDHPGVSQRRFLCDGSERVGAWTLDRLRADGGSHVDAELGLRRFTSPAAAAEARAVAIATFGRSGVIHIADGAIAWCYAEAVWEGDLLWTLEYGCHISTPHVPALRDVRAALLKGGEPIRGAVGVQGWHSGYSWLVDATGTRVEVPRAERFTHYARVRGVAGDDKLWVRRSAEREGTLVGHLRPDARCVPLLYGPAEGGWWHVDFSNGVPPPNEWDPITGWSGAAYLEREPPGACP